MAFKLKEIASVGSWHEAFEIACNLLDKHQLTSVAIVSEDEFARGTYFATSLKEFAYVMGGLNGVLDNLEGLCPLLYKAANNFRLEHGHLQAATFPGGAVDAWILAIVYS